MASNEEGELYPEIPHFQHYPSKTAEKILKATVDALNILRKPKIKRSPISAVMCRNGRPVRVIFDGQIVEEVSETRPVSE